jgi:hypothetical protein
VSSNWTEIATAQDLSMPSLEDLEVDGRLHIQLIGFRNLFTGMGVPYVAGSHAHAHYKNFVRLIDTAVRRYESARMNLQRAVDRPPESTGVAEVVRSLSDLEAVFNLLHRALTLLVRLKEAREAPVGSKDLLPFDEDAVQVIRNVSEHIDSALESKELGINDDVMPRVWREGITFAGERISYATMAMWLGRLHIIARTLIDHDPLAAERPAIQTPQG